MLRKSIASLLLVPVLAVVVLIDADPAAAQDVYGVPTWAIDSADTFQSECPSFIADVLGVNSAMATGWFGWKHMLVNDPSAPLGNRIVQKPWFTSTQNPAVSEALKTAMNNSPGTTAARSSTSLVHVGPATPPPSAGYTRLSTAARGTGKLGLVVGGIGVGACGVSNVLEHFFGDTEVGSEAPLNTATDVSGLVQCSTMPIPPVFAAPGDRCIVGWWGTAAPSGRQAVLAQRFSRSYSQRLENGEVAAPGYSANELSPGRTSATIVVPCASPEVNCGVFPHKSTPSAATSNAVDFTVWRDTGSWNNYGWLRTPVPGVNDRGTPSRLASTVTCVTPQNTDAQNFAQWTAPFWEDEQPPGLELATCPTGKVRAAVLTQRQIPAAGSGSANPVQWTISEDLIDWELPTSTRTNSVTMACLVPGADCDQVVDPNDGQRVLVGGLNGVSVPNDSPTVDELAREMMDDSVWSIEEPVPGTDPDVDPDPEPDPDPDPNPNPDGTTGANPNSGGIPGTATDVSGGDPDSCWPSGWGWLNPIEWVLNPIKCALVWAFWDQAAADEMLDLWGDTGEGWQLAATGSSITASPAAGPCIYLDSHEICSSVVLEAEVPTAATVFLTAIISFFILFEIIGLFARATVN